MSKHRHVFIYPTSFSLLVDAIKSGEDVIVEAKGFNPLYIPGCKNCKRGE